METVSREWQYTDSCIRSENMLDLFQKGGPLMYPLLLGSVLMIAVIVERAFHFIGTGEKPKVFDRVKSLTNEGEYGRAKKVAEKERSPVFLLVC
jgi:biopolymer transport protein ExbB